MARRAGTIAIVSAVSVCVWMSARASSLDQAAAVMAPVVDCSRAWVGKEPSAEAFLKSADIARIEEVPIGVTRPKRAFFTSGGPVRSVAWKPLPPGSRRGFWESYKSEIAAYELDKLLGMHMVPPVVERTVGTEVGAAIWWIEPAKGWKIDSPIRGPEPAWSKQVSRMKLFDQLIANIDRNQGNLLYDNDWHLMLIDHSRAFTDRRSLDGIAAPSGIDRELWGRIDTLTLPQLQQALGAWIGEKEIQAILVRRDRMRAAIARMVRSKGEAGVFFD
jgi:hypothetical protein